MKSQVDAADAAVSFVLASLDQAAAFQVVEEAYQGGALDAERGGEFPLTHAFAETTDICERPPGRFGQAIGAELAVHCLAQPSSDARHAKAELTAGGGFDSFHNRNIASYLFYGASQIDGLKANAEVRSRYLAV